MSTYRLMVYAQKIEEKKIREINKEGKRPWFDYYSHQKPKKRFFHQDTSMTNKGKSPNKNSHGGGLTFERTRFPTCEKRHSGRCLAHTNDCFSFFNKVHKLRDFPNIKEIEKEVNHASLDPNSSRRTLSVGVEIGKITNFRVDSSGKFLPLMIVVLSYEMI